MASMGSCRGSLLLSCFPAVLMLLTVNCAGLRHAQQRRESVYQQTLRSYPEALTPGTTRQAVEEHLEQRNPNVTNILDILIVIGRDLNHWFCSRRPVLLLFHFATTDAGKNLKPSLSDPLQSIGSQRLFRVSVLMVEADLKSVRVGRWEECLSPVVLTASPLGGHDLRMKCQCQRDDIPSLGTSGRILLANANSHMTNRSDRESHGSGGPAATFGTKYS
jgi:hypothetical protein